MFFLCWLSSKFYFYQDYIQKGKNLPLARAGTNMVDKKIL